MTDRTYYDIQKATQMLPAEVVHNTPEERSAACRVIAGSKACKNATETKLFMDMLGLTNADVSAIS